jgi:hypothetical protein
LGKVATRRRAMVVLPTPNVPLSMMSIIAYTTETQRPQRFLSSFFFSLFSVSSVPLW